MILGNLLNRAFRVVPNQSFTYLAYTGRTTNELGFDVATYATGVTLKGSPQAVPRNKYQILGLDFQKEYITVFVSQDVVDISRDVSADKIQFSSKTYLCLSLTPWYNMDGWNEILCVRVDA